MLGFLNESLDDEFERIFLDKRLDEECKRQVLDSSLDERFKRGLELKIAREFG